MIHVVRPGESIQRIAALHYGDWTLWPAIRDFNSVLSQAYGFDWWRNPPANTPLELPELPDAVIKHIVAEGDTWHSLSLSYCSTEAFAFRIRAYNGGGTLRDRAGATVTIPALVDQKIRAILEQR